MTTEGGFTHVLITRPDPQGSDLTAHLAALLGSVGAEALLLPAYSFCPVDLDRAAAERLEAIGEGVEAGARPLLVFSSTRAVEFGARVLKPSLLAGACVAAMGPATAASLEASGVRVDLVAPRPHNSEAMLAALDARIEGRPGPGTDVVIVTAEGGRPDLGNWLAESGCAVLRLATYRRTPCPVDESVIERISTAGRMLSVWTSAEAMKALSTALPPAAWYRICSGEWLVVSSRLQRLARAFGPPAVHVSSGPSNEDITAAVRRLF